MRPTHLCTAVAVAIVLACTTVHAAPVHYKSFVVSKSSSDYQDLDALASRGLNPDIFEEIDSVIQAASKPEVPSSSVSAPVQYSASQRAAHVWGRPASGQDAGKTAQSIVTTSAYPRLPAPVNSAPPWSASTAENVWAPKRPMSRVWSRPQQAERLAVKQIDSTLKAYSRQVSAKASPPRLPAATSSGDAREDLRHVEASTSQPDRKLPRPDDSQDHPGRMLNDHRGDPTESSSSKSTSKTLKLRPSTAKPGSTLSDRLQPPLEQQSNESSMSLAGRLQLPSEPRMHSALAGRLKLPLLESHLGEAAAETSSNFWSRLNLAATAKDKDHSTKPLLNGEKSQEETLKKPKSRVPQMLPIPGGRLAAYKQVPIPPTNPSSVAPFPYSHVDLPEIPAQGEHPSVPERTYHKEHIQLTAQRGADLFSGGQQAGLPKNQYRNLSKYRHRAYPHELFRDPDGPAIFRSEHETKNNQASKLELKKQVMTFPIQPSHSPNGTRRPVWDGMSRTNVGPGSDRVILTKNQNEDVWQIVTCISHTVDKDGKRCYVQGTRGPRVG